MKLPLRSTFEKNMSIVNMEQRLYIQLMSKEIDGNQFRFLFPYDLLEFFGVCLPYNENECLKMCDDRPTTENLRLLWSAVENRFAQLKIVISVLKLRASDRKSCVFEIKELIVCLRPQEKGS
ncbi:hypothetical protein AB6A40_003689 [Gnathostoma spinigerum]|uniref:Uncharacterized protein n=1 Tax=Gnathostoma spinigerum TaxID=75299 RepID=A0ABD6EL33_9BILA